MAGEDKNVGAEERVHRSVARTLGNLVFVLVLLGLAAAWAWLGFYQLGNGQAAIILRFGRNVDRWATQDCAGICRRRSRRTRS
jgi:hypothetical protein